MQQHGARPLWLGYLSTPDVDGQLSAIVADGGKVQMPATNLPTVGRIAMVTDPQGVPFYLMTPVPPPGAPDATSDVFDRHAPQRVNWNELASPDLAASKAFYSRHFGFEFNESMSMGPMGDYCFIDHHGQRLGAVMQRQDERQPPVWLFYFGVPSIAAATRAIEANGGTVLDGTPRNTDRRVDRYCHRSGWRGIRTDGAQGRVDNRGRDCTSATPAHSSAARGGSSS